MAAEHLTDAGIYTPDQCCGGYCVEVGGEHLAHNLPNREDADYLMERIERIVARHRAEVAEQIAQAIEADHYIGITANEATDRAARIAREHKEGE